MVGDVESGETTRLDRPGLDDWLCALSHASLVLYPRRGVDLNVKMQCDAWARPVVIFYCVQHVLVEAAEPELSRLAHDATTQPPAH